jgi:hypothetical protein
LREAVEHIVQLAAVKGVCGAVAVAETYIGGSQGEQVRVTA